MANVINKYKNMSTDEINKDLNSKRHSFSILIANFEHDFNIGTAIRNANAFMANTVYVYGRRKYDRRGTVGTHHYTNLVFIKDLSELPKNIPIISFEDNPQAFSLEKFRWPKKCIMAFGQEVGGIPQEIIDKSLSVVYIKQYGSVRSLNVGTASGIGMFSWSLQHGQIKL